MGVDDTHNEPPLQKGEVVVFAGGKTGTITRAYQMEDKYAVKELGATREIRGKDDAFFYFGRADLRRAVPVGPSAAVETAPHFSMDTGGQRLDGVLTSPVVLASMQAPPVQIEPKFEPPPGPERLLGRVKWYLKEKGFGKIEPKVPKGQPPGEDVFVHRNQMEGGPDGPHARAIVEGTRVIYELTVQDGKPCACNVEVEGLARALAAIDTGPAAGTSKQDLTRHLLYTGLRVGSFQEKGFGKASMEDRFVSRAGIAVDSLGTVAGAKVVCSFFGVFDGHSGASCSEFLSVNLDRSVFECIRSQSQRKEVGSEKAVRDGLLAAFRTTEHNFFQYANKLEGGAAMAWCMAGSTASTVMFFGPDEEGRLRLAVANAGDSRSVLGRKDGNAVRLSEDHTPNVLSERRRIEQEGAGIAQVQGIWRIVLRHSRHGENIAGLSVSRGFGDLDYKQPAAVVTAVPDVTFRTLNLREDSFVIIGSDGIWGPISDTEAVRIVSAGLREGTDDPARLAAQRLVEAAHQRDPNDDKTALVIWFGDVPMAPPTVVAAPARVGAVAMATAKLGASSVAEDMFGNQAAPLGADLGQLDDLFASYAREIAQGASALEAAKRRRKM